MRDAAKRYWNADRPTEADFPFLIAENTPETPLFQLQPGHFGMLPGMHNVWYMYDRRCKNYRE